MKLDFEIKNIPTERQREYFAAYLEGELKIFVRDLLLFNQSDILLVELAIFIYNWLNRIKAGYDVNFVYETMDYDEPIITVVLESDEYCKIDSIWKEVEGSLLVRKKDVITAFEGYLANLGKALINKCDFELKNVLLM